MTVKHSLAIHGHRTSITLEPAFWARLNRLSGERDLTPARLVAEIDESRPADVNLSSAIRVFLLEEALSRLAQDSAVG